MDEDDILTPMEYLFRAVQHVTGYAQTYIGLQLESCEGGVENTGELNLEELEDWQVEEFTQVLFSCHVIEATFGPCPSPEYPKVVAALKAELLPELSDDEPKKH